jgi:putative phosphoesterase
MRSQSDRVMRSLGGLLRSDFAESLAGELGVMSAAMPPTLEVAGPRIGVIADSHCVAGDGSDLPSSVLDAFAGCEAIVHRGDLTATAVLDRLATVAPVVAVRSTGDPSADQHRLFDGRLLLRWSTTLIGVVADLPHNVDPSDVFGTDVDVVCSGTTHIPSVTRAGTTTLINPGSPTIPLSSAGPTVAIVDLASPSGPTVNVIHLDMPDARSRT